MAGKEVSHLDKFTLQKNGSLVLKHQNSDENVRIVVTIHLEYNESCENILDC